MAYDAVLAERIRNVLSHRKGLTERKMFGGVAFMLRGNMCCGVLKDELILRLGPDLGDKALAESRTREFDFTGRPMRGMVVVEAEGIARDEDLRQWVLRAIDFAKTLPPK